MASPSMVAAADHVGCRRLCATQWTARLLSARRIQSNQPSSHVVCHLCLRDNFAECAFGHQTIGSGVLHNLVYWYWSVRRDLRHISRATHAGRAYDGVCGSVGQRIRFLFDDGCVKPLCCVGPECGYRPVDLASHAGLPYVWWPTLLHLADAMGRIGAPIAHDVCHRQLRWACHVRQSQGQVGHCVPHISFHHC